MTQHTKWEKIVKGDIMRNIFLDIKIKKELKEFKKFKESYAFQMKNIEQKKDGSLFCDDVCIREGEKGEWVGETETFVNVGYKFHGALPKVLSNLFPYRFYFKGFWLESAEAVFQGFKFKNKKTQRYLFAYKGLDSNNIKVAADHNWKDNMTVYFQGKPIKRDSKEFDDFIDELYVSLIQNPLYRNALKKVGDKYILHALGEKTKMDTVFTREEFERELNCLKEFVRSKN